MKAYRFNDKNKYIGSVECQIDPLESSLRGCTVYTLPGNATFVNPNDEKEGYDQFWNGTTWEYKEKKKKREYSPYVPSAEEQKINVINARLFSLSQDIIQVQVGEIIPDINERKQEFIRLHNELRVLLGKEPRAFQE